MNVAVTTLSERMPEVMDALDKKEEVILLHKGKKIAQLKPVFDLDAEIERLKNHPAVGMWDDREDMKDPSEWVRKIRRPRYAKLFAEWHGDKE